MIEQDEFLELFHIGTPRHSGRYPWGSGENPNQRYTDFLGRVEKLEKEGLTPVEVAKALGLETTTNLRTAKTIAKNGRNKEYIQKIEELSAKGLSNVAIGEELGIGESRVRQLKNASTKEKSTQLDSTVETLKELADKTGMLDIGTASELYLGVTPTLFNTAVAKLESEGYHVYKRQVEQAGTGKKTNLKILAKPEVEYREIYDRQNDITPVSKYSEDGGRTFLGLHDPIAVDPKRVAVRYGPDGGAHKDGVIELRRGVDDISLGSKRYAQVRINVGGSHYLKGMAMYSDDLPDGVDMLFNTNKPNKTGDPLDVMKPLKVDKATGDIDADNPFGSIVRQRFYIDKDGKRKLSALNIVGTEDPDGIKTPGEEGAWYNWSKTLSSQMLSKQTPSLAKEQLGISYDNRKKELDEIMALTNPTIKKKLLLAYSDGADSAAVHLKAAGLPRTRNHVILPINSLKDNEVYAPQYNNGESVALIRHPHGGRFEIPILTVNNKNADGRRLLQDAKDAVGINHKVAERLSGADFDGDTVLVIPNNSGKIKSEPPLRDLKDFDSKSYKLPEGQKFSGNKQQLMGDISNLITDMTVKEAPFSEIARAVKHSMVVIDAEKHDLDYKRSADENNIRQLKAKYQTKPDGRVGGASTLISRASSDIRVNKRKARSAKNGGPIDPETGKLMWEETGETRIKRNISKKTGQVTSEKEVPLTQKSKKMLEVDDARDLMSPNGGTVMEQVYADYANKNKALANSARKEYLATPNLKYSPSANKAYKPEVDSLTIKLNEARKNAPAERKAQLVADSIIKAKKQAAPDMDRDEEKKIRSQALVEARLRAGAKKERIEITPREWEAIQAGAISNNKLEMILDNTDLDKIKALATPRERTVMVPAKLARAKTMMASGRYTPAEVASALGVSTSTLHDALESE